MTRRSEVQAAMALRIAADLVTGLVLIGVLPKKHATLLLDASRTQLLEDEPDLQPEIQSTFAVLSAQIELDHADLKRRLKALDDD